jgi:hypothetical protein
MVERDPIPCETLSEDIEFFVRIVVRSFLYLRPSAGHCLGQLDKVRPSWTLYDSAGHCLTEGVCLTFCLSV